MAKILVIDDEPGIVRFVRRGLEGDGHRVYAAFDGNEGLRVAAKATPELVVLDLLMPGVSGMGVLAALLADHPRAKVLVLSAVGDVQARVRCLDVGAADFLGKPFALSELLARVRSRLREPPTAAPPAETLVFGPLRLDLRTRQLHSDTRSVDLPQREFSLMQHLMRNGGTICTRAELLSEVWGYTFDPGSNVVDATIARLRSKIDWLQIDIDAPRIETVRNVGYALKQA